ncbi:hypothetical protein NW768_010254 [Fusarium equiseti]|uniref:Uncharacterized protein n=1 Tax=Fusarium equiseti TaxID=61235 RepID=A0ABQ8R178_FUSEQ|nr:hypothetical protein NW768_010254 [Fusarium equiseti]
MQSLRYIYVTAAYVSTPRSLTSPIQAEGPECLTKGLALQVTPECIDPVYNKIIIDREVDVDVPILHRKISGHFEGTTIDFNIYLPKTNFQGRFFQLVYPTQDSTASDRTIGFGADSGGYTNHVSGAGGYRADAAVAKMSRHIAADYYNYKGKIYGYVYGGSGGSFVTVGAIENTFDIWQGAVPLIQAVPVSLPNNFCIRAFGQVAFDSVATSIIDPIRPGGSGDPFSALDLTRRRVLEEVTHLGIPIRSWEDYTGVAQNRTQLWSVMRNLVVPTIRSVDPTYFSDFWTKPGYLGTENSKLGELWRSSLYELNATVRKVIDGPNGVPCSIILDRVIGTPPPHGLTFEIISQKNGETLGQFTATLNMSSKLAAVHPENNATIIKSLSEGVLLKVNNRDTLAASSYHRHQIPTEDGFYAWDYLLNADGTPKYPQRPVLLGSKLSQGASGGGTHTGNITGKVIVMGTLLDYDAFPWHADWYKKKVEKSLGNRFGDNYRLYFADNADHEMHGVPKSMTHRVVEFTGMYEQHLRDLAAWVESGKQPVAQTVYSVKNGQVVVPKTAAERKGIQAVIDLRAEGKSRAAIGKGHRISLKAHVEAPAGVGIITSVEWDFEGNGNFVKGDFEKRKTSMEVSASTKFQQTGVYFPTVRVAVHREGDAESPYAQVLNLGRMRLTVH